MDTLLPRISAERGPTVAIDDAAHSPHLDQPERFLAELGAHLSSA